MLNDAAISVNRCVWGPDGLMLGKYMNYEPLSLNEIRSTFYITLMFLSDFVCLGVAFSKHIVHLYTYNPTGELRQHLEVCSVF